MSRTTLPTTCRVDSARLGRVNRNLWLRRLKSCVWLSVSPLCLVLLPAGCTSPNEFVRNGFKVGPNYERPPAPLATEWIDAANPQRQERPRPTTATWWAVFGDPVLNDLVRTAYAQNVNLRVAGTRVLEARAQQGHRGRHTVPTAASRPPGRPHAGEDQPQRRRPVPASLLQQLGDRSLRLLGDRLLGQDPPQHRNGRRPRGGLGGRLRQRHGHPHR